MGEVYGLTNSEISFLRALAIHHVPFMIVGLSAAAMQGAPVVTQDIDLWFKRLDDPNLRDALREEGVAYVPPQIDQPPMFAGANLEKLDIVVNMTGLGSFDEEAKNTILLMIGDQGIPVLKLERILESKKATNRQKDLLTIPILADVIRVRQNSTSK